MGFPSWSLGTSRSCSKGTPKTMKINVRLTNHELMATAGEDAHPTNT
jgi:hypothetical protein